jgi:isopentenyl diphosphate isomerase/L-lactate dehydrogenase-like FMN-dependent dehydrogenase
LTASDYAAYDFFGDAVAISADIIVVGVSLADVSGQFNAGAAYVFARNSGGADQWGQVKKLTASNCASGDIFGTSVAISGDIIVAGALYADVSGQTNAGAAYLFEATNQEIFLPLLLR